MSTLSFWTAKSAALWEGIISSSVNKLLNSGVVTGGHHLVSETSIRFSSKMSVEASFMSLLYNVSNNVFSDGGNPSLPIVQFLGATTFTHSQTSGSLQ